jgi:hypothetical protein
MTARTEAFEVLCAFVHEGIDAPELGAITDVLNGIRPDWWTFIQPSTVLVWFLTKKNGEAKISQTSERLKSLQANFGRLNGIKLGHALGQMVADFSWFGFGGPRTMPVGEPATEAQKLARAV